MRWIDQRSQGSLPVGGWWKWRQPQWRGEAYRLCRYVPLGRNDIDGDDDGDDDHDHTERQQCQQHEGEVL